MPKRQGRGGGCGGGGRGGALTAESQAWGKKAENWPAGFGKGVCMQCKIHGHGGTGRDLKIWLQSNYEGL